MINVVNKYKHLKTDFDIYIGRGSILGNPYTSIVDRPTRAEFIAGSREESIELFEKYIREKIFNKDVSVCNELNRIWKMSKKGGVNLVCSCHPRLCHGDIVKNIIEEKL